MLTVFAALYALMVACWYRAACSAGFALQWRWILLGFTLLAVAAAWFVRRPRARPPAAVVWLSLLVLYGMLLAPVSKAAPLATAKCVVFGATTAACLLGGSLLVERFGRDRLFVVWRWLWRALLLVSVVMVPLGLWRRGNEGLYGPTSNPNQYGSILLSLGLVLLVPGAAKGSGWLWKAEVFAGAVLLLLTRARASMLGAAVACLLAVASQPGRRRLLVAGGAALAIALLLVTLPDTSVREVQDVAEGATVPEVFKTRQQMWEESWTAMVEGLPMGFGWGVKAHAPAVWQFDTKSGGYGREEGTSWLPVGEELGLPGFLLMGLLWFSLARATSSLPFRPRVLARAVLGAYFALACFEGWLLSPGNWESMAFWTSVGIVFARPRATDAAPAPVLSPVPGAVAGVRG